MWERIAVSSVLMIGAVVLFIAFTVLLFLLEKKDQKKKQRRTAVVRCTKTGKAA